MKHVVVVVPKGEVVLSSITGTYEILTRANGLWQRAGNKSKMEVTIASFEKELTLDAGFFSVKPKDIKKIQKCDLIIVPSLGHDYDNIVRDNTQLINWIQSQHKKGSEVASICTGAFIVASTGLLDGRVCSTHWNAEAGFRRMFPNIELHTDKLITSAERIYTNGGAYSFLNLILFLVEKYFDRQTAILCSKIFQIDIERSSQSPFFIFHAQKNHGDELVTRAQSYIEKNLRARISFEALASQLAISRRNFDRRFIKATGNTPVEYLQRVKVEVAKSTLEKGRKTVFEVMNDVGYSDDKAFREVFKRITGMSPLDYKAKFTTRPLITSR
ncbi:MAG TPA: helix-turn-helix domain-containing protein [Chryseosolibacter sp.]